MHQNPLPSLHAPRLGPLVLSLMAVGTLAIGGCAGTPWGEGLQGVRGGYRPGDKVTVLLPAKGPIADVADAVRDGVRAAHAADDTGAKPELVFADADQPSEVPAALATAVKAGSTYAIGPIQKPAVDSLAEGSALKIPTLALNQSTAAGRSVPNLYQFALSPETEALAVANRAHAAGFGRALMLYPASDAGRRRADAFRSRWKGLGGTVVAEAGFDPAATDYAGVVGKLMRRQADFLFLSAEASQAQAIYPLVSSRAPGLTVIATSEVYPGNADGVRDKALTGLYFVDLPWVLGIGAEQDPLARAKVRPGARYLSTPLGLRLYAMGIDAYRLAPRLETLSKTPSLTFPGETGTLSVDSGGRVQRQLALGQFTAEGPRPAVIDAKARTGATAEMPAPGQGRPASTGTAPAQQGDLPKAEPRRPRP